MKRLLLGILIVIFLFPTYAFSLSGAMQGGGGSSGRIVQSFDFGTAGTFTDGDTTPSVYGNANFATANTSGTTISKLDDLKSGEFGVIYINDGNTTLGCTSSNLVCNGGSDYSATDGDFLIYYSPDGTNALIGITKPNAGGGDSAAIHENVSSEIAGITAKTTPLDADYLILESAADSNAKRSLTLTNLWANYLKAKADALYEPSGITESDISDLGTTILLDSDISGSVQAYSANLDTFSAIAPSANVQSLLGAADYAAFRTLLGMGTVYQYNVGTGANNIPQLSGTPGTPDGTKFLRDDLTWAVPAGGGNVSKVGIPAQYEWGEWTGDGTLKGTAVTGSSVVCTDANGSPTACSNLTDVAIPTQASLSVDDLITLSGVSEGAQNLGTFTGSTITDNQTVKAALQLLETAVEAALTNPMTTAGDVIYGGASGTPTRLAKGSNNSIFGINGSGTLGWYTNFASDDSDYQFYDSVDSTKQLQFELGSITTGNKRTVTVRDSDGTMAYTTDLDTWAEHPTLTAANILVGNASNEAASVAMSGDVGIDNAGATTIQANAVDYLATNGSSKSLTPVIDDPDNFASNFTGDNLYGGTFIANAAGTAALPAVAVNMHFTYIMEGANANVVNPDGTGTADTIYMNGTAAAQDENIESSTSGAQCYFQYRAADTWMATCVNFAEATP